MKTILLFLFAFLFAGCGAVLSQVGKVASRFMTDKTSDLSEAAVQVRFVRNLYPPEARTREATFVGDDWEAGQNMAVINFAKRKGIGFLEIDGTITVDGEPIEHAGNGFYGLILDADDVRAKTFVVETTSGQKASFSVGPAEPIRIKSVNGQTEGAAIDMQSEFTLELENPAGTEDSEIRIALLFDMMGQRAFQEIGNFRSQDVLTIPADIFRHYPGTALAQGETYLLVERFRVEPGHSPSVGASQVIATAWDAVPVQLTGGSTRTVPGMGIALNKDLSNGLYIDGNTDIGGLSYTVTKPNAFLGRPFERATRLGIASFTVRATKLRQSRVESSSSTMYSGGYKITTTTTTYEVRQFPKIPDAYWDALVNEMYAAFEQELRARWDVELVPIDAAMRAPSYADLESIDDQVTVVEVEKGYKGSKNLIPTTLGAIVSNISTTFASDRVDSRLMREMGVDGLVAVTLDLEMQTDFDASMERTTRLAPRFSFRFSGPPNGYTYGPTIYGTGVIAGGGALVDDSRDALPEEFLKEVVQQDALVAAFGEALDRLQAEERAEPAYARIWELAAPTQLTRR